MSTNDECNSLKMYFDKIQVGVLFLNVIFQNWYLGKDNLNITDIEDISLFTLVNLIM